MPRWRAPFRIAATALLLIAGTTQAQTPEPGAAGGEITNRAVIEFGTGGIPTIEAESTIEVVAPDLPGELSAYRVSGAEADAIELEVPPPDYSTTARAGGPFRPVPEAAPGAGASVISRLARTGRVRTGEQVVFVLDDPLANTDPGRRDNALLEVQDSVSGDTELLRIHETGADTGLFAGGICACDGSGREADGRLATRENSRLIARSSNRRFPKRQFENSVTVGPVSPTGRVFDSRSGTPLDGARITIVNAETGAVADVYGEDLVSPFPSTVVSGGRPSDASGQSYDFAPGSYRFPYVEPGRYLFILEPPDGYVAPSRISPEQIRAAVSPETRVTGASYLEPFEIAPGQTLLYDIPLDGAAMLDLSRSASSDRLAVGEALRFTVTVGASVPGDTEVDLEDRLPQGLNLVRGSLRIDGQRVGGRLEVSADGRRLELAGLKLRAGARRQVSYLARVTPAAPDRGILTSRSTASGEEFATLSAAHRLEVVPAFERDESAVLGQVRVGCGPPRRAARDLSGIRVMLANGRFAETDARGRFTFRGIVQGTHVLAVDPLTLPRGYVPVLCGNNTRRAGSAQSIFVETREGFVRNVRFHIRETGIDEAPEPEIAMPPGIEAYDADWLDAAPRRVGIAFPPDNHLPPTRSLSAAIVRGKGQRTELYLNGEPVPELYRRPAIAGDGGERFLEIWRGAELEGGVNRLRLVLRDADGAVVREQTRSIRFADTPAGLEVVEEMSDLRTDGRSRPRVVFRATDAEGTPLHPGAIVTVSVERPFAFAADARMHDAREGAEPMQRTTATVDADGYFRMRLAPSRRSGLARFAIEGADERPVATARISAAERPWTVVGLAEGTLAGDRVADAMADPGDRRILSFGDVAIDGRAAIYAEGVVRDDWLLTLRYDSAIDPDERDFFAEDPDRDYIVYGDESREGDAASSRSPLYFHLEREGVDLLYGDFDTGVGRDRLAEYTRRLTGGRAIFEDERQRLTLFAAETSLGFAEDRFAADGTSGPFDLRRADILPNSETIVIETTDRSDPARVINRVELRRGSDYTIDYVDGRIFFSAPILSRTPELDPNTIVVTYETETDRRSGFILGGRYDVRVNDRLRAGLTLVHEDDIADTDGAGRLLGVDAEYRVSDTLTFGAEVAMSQQEASNVLEAGREAHAAEVTLRYDDGASVVDAYVRTESTGFGIENIVEGPQTINSAGLTASVVLADRSEVDEDGETQTDILRFEASARSEHNVDTRETLTLAEGLVLREENRRTRGIGLRFAERRNAPEGPDGRVLKAIGRATYESEDGRFQMAMGQEVSLWEDGGLAEADRGTLTLRYDVTERLSVWGTNEVALGRDFRVDILAAGADYAVWPGAVLTGGLVNAMTRRNAQTVGHLGLRQELEMSEYATGYLGVEAQDSLAGNLEDSGPLQRAGLTNPRLSEGFVVYRAGFERVTEGWKASVDTELGYTDENDHVRLQARATTPLTANLSVGAYANFFSAVRKDGTRELDHEVRFSSAWRPEERPIIVLEQFEVIRERDEVVDETRVINSLIYTEQLDDRNEVTARHGMKYIEQSFDGETVTDFLMLVGGEYRHDLSEKFDIGVHGAALWSAEGRTSDFSAGVSVGLTPFKNGWLSVGYNVTGFRDEDFSENGYTNEGAFVQFRFKIDQENFNEIF
ncbi:carboxypeptidase-like regulatory domain-containing protein [Roseovarius indicus]|uniref:DUF11 domain-containing protein n=1 Tax=Roseovarius indicus TaxID=540747 RepID=A0A0T5PBL3_9RHOB|nr:carboxypeptidase-like regulatory domain-containing protein [Roseovarius indicus]KRS18449.1 hypothetical protein XM52_06405 [Roseovarius indicus]QEW25426.1 hypothetical protein RIdsm_01212 [Roseovarius indicus]SFE05358.1 hypothetical protein SAMN04488031_104334 [Roseovarius indicus]